MLKVRIVTAAVAGLAGLALFALGLAAGADTGQPLQTAIFLPEGTGTDFSLTMSQVAGFGASAVVLDLAWSSVVSPSAGSDPGFVPTDPTNPDYNWSSFDAEVEAANAEGLSVIGVITDAPTWALDSPPGSPSAPATLPDPTQLGNFAEAAALHYASGNLAVKAWQVWNEPNISLFLQPQFDSNGNPISPGWYRDMVNAVYAAVKPVEPNDLIVAGGTAPFYDNTPSVVADDPDWGPLSFMRDLLCLSDTLQPTCNDPIHFDVWSTHPYTEGSPEHQASLPNDVSLPELPEMDQTLQAGVAAGNVTSISNSPPLFWVTEFSWNSSPPNASGASPPIDELVRWVPEALQEMWESGVSLVTWFTLADFPYPSSPYQAGLEYIDGTPKAYAEAFDFPVVGTPDGTSIDVWGWTPSGTPGTVTIQQSLDGDVTWTPVATVASDANGIFQTSFTSSAVGDIRAVDGAQTSDAFPLSPDPDIDSIFGEFGGPVLEPIPTTTTTTTTTTTSTTTTTPTTTAATTTTSPAPTLTPTSNPVTYVPVNTTHVVSSKKTTTVAKTTAKHVELSVKATGKGAVSRKPAGSPVKPAGKKTAVVTAFSYSAGAKVVLSAKPKAGWRFAKWLGACHGTKTACSLKLAKTVSATASFVKK